MRAQWRESIEENGRLQTQLDTYSMDAHNKQALLSGEVRRRDEAVQALKMDNMHYQETVSALEEKVSAITSSIYAVFLLCYPSLFEIFNTCVESMKLIEILIFNSLMQKMICRNQFEFFVVNRAANWSVLWSSWEHNSPWQRQR